MSKGHKYHYGMTIGQGHGGGVGGEDVKHWEGSKAKRRGQDTKAKC
jgi:hypothetical protein